MDKQARQSSSLPARWWAANPTLNLQQRESSESQMIQICRVCGEKAAGYHFGAFTCEGCKSFFGRTYNNLSSVSECKNNGECVINKKNRTSCKACRLRKCLYVGMSKSGSRYGRRSNWFKIHCLLQEQSSTSTNAQSAERGQTAEEFPGWMCPSSSPSTSVSSMDVRNNNAKSPLAESPTRDHPGISEVTKNAINFSANYPFWPSGPNLLPVATSHAIPYLVTPFLQSAFPPPNFVLPFLSIPTSTFAREDSPNSSISGSPPLPPQSPQKLDYIGESARKRIRSPEEQPLDLSYKKKPKNTGQSDSSFSINQEANDFSVSRILDR